MTTYVYLIIGVVIACIVSFLGLENYSLKKDNKTLQKNEGIYKTQIKLLADNIAIKDKDIELCNVRTRKLKQEGEERARKANKALQEARKLSNKHKELADQLLAKKRLEGKSECEAAKDLFNDYLDLRAKDEATNTPH